MRGAQSHYTGEKGRRYHAAKRSVSDAAYEWISRLRAEKIQPFISTHDVVFEYGTGSGWNLAALKCKQRIGCDVSTLFENKLRQLQIEFFTSSDNVAAQSADIVLCHHTLEHVSHPARVLAELNRILKPGGKLLLHVPFEYERRYRAFDKNEPNHHLFSWNVQTLGNLVEECGFEVQHAEIGTFGYDRFAAVNAEKFKLGEPGFRLLRRLVHLVKPGREVRIVAGKNFTPETEC